MRKLLFVTAIALMLTDSTFGQDPQFSQFYAAPLYLNPAFAGSTGLTRVGANYRNQWPGLPANFVTYSVYGDHYFDDYNSGIGMLLYYDTEGNAGFRTISASLQYSYNLHINENMAFRAGFDAGYAMRGLTGGNLLWSDQIDPDGNITGPTAEPFGGGNLINHFDVGAGGLFYTRRLWIGFAANHLTQPSLSYYGGKDKLHIKYSGHIGYKIPLPTYSDNRYRAGFRDISVTPTALYKQQGIFSQLDAGLYFNYEPFVLGGWYRGIPVKTVEGVVNNESIILLVGFSSNGLNIGYSYDFPLSKLSLNSGGSHEVSISYEFFVGDPRKPPKNIRSLPCPRF